MIFIDTNLSVINYQYPLDCLYVNSISFLLISFLFTGSCYLRHCSNSTSKACSYLLMLVCTDGHLDSALNCLPIFTNPFSDLFRLNFLISYYSCSKEGAIVKVSSSSSCSVCSWFTLFPLKNLLIVDLSLSTLWLALSLKYNIYLWSLIFWAFRTDIIDSYSIIVSVCSLSLWINLLSCLCKYIFWSFKF